METINDTASLPGTRREILRWIKNKGPASIAELATNQKVSHEAMRRQVIVLEKEGWLEKTERKRGSETVGRPVSYYRLTRAGEHLFPRKYDALAVGMIQGVEAKFGREGLKEVLEGLVSENVESLQGMVEGLSLPERLRVLANLYGEGDEYMSVGSDEKGYYLAERNCPYQNVAESMPVICNVTINTLMRLTGRRVVREEKLQDGKGHCLFRIQEEQIAQPDAQAFEFE